MPLTLLITAILLFLLTALRFTRRLQQEALRQRALTWPHATAVLAGDSDELPVAATSDLDEPIFYHARLVRPYTFYARGEKWTGDLLAPELVRLNANEARLFLRELGRQRRVEVRYNPHNPKENYLTVGKSLLSNAQLLLYALTGVIAPLLIGIPTFRWWQTGIAPEVLTGTVLWGTLGLSLIVTLLYFVAKPVFNLGLLLQPTPEITATEDEQTDELLESLERIKIAKNS